LGWDCGKKILFQSAEHDVSSGAMEEFNTFEIPGDKASFAYMRAVENGK